MVTKDVEDAARILIGKNRKVEAIKLITDRTGLGLKIAKDYVDNLQVVSIPKPISESVNIDAGLINLINQGKKLEAIKLYKNKTGLALAASKDYIDKLIVSPSGKPNQNVARDTEISKILNEQSFKIENQAGFYGVPDNFLIKLSVIVLLTLILITAMLMINN